MSTAARIQTKQLKYDSKFIAALREVDARSETRVKAAPALPALPNEKMATWLRDLEQLIEKVDEWKVESAFAACLNTTLPLLEKDIGLLLLRVVGADDALVRAMWAPVSRPPHSCVVPRIPVDDE